MILPVHIMGRHWIALSPYIKDKTVCFMSYFHSSHEDDRFNRLIASRLLAADLAPRQVNYPHLLALDANQDFSGHRGAILITALYNYFFNTTDANRNHQPLSLSDILAIRAQHAELTVPSSPSECSMRF